jgi:peroxiredoxin
VQQGHPVSLNWRRRRTAVLIACSSGGILTGCTTEFTQAGVTRQSFTALESRWLGISRDMTWALEAVQEEGRGEESLASWISI